MWMDKMAGILRYLLRNKKINDAAQKALIFLNNKSYSYIGVLATIYENGLHPKHRLMRYHDFFIDNIRKNSRVLDIGCGNGALTYDLAKKARKVVAIDNNRKNINIASKIYSRDNIEYLVGDATTCALKEKFDYITLSNVLEYIDDRKRFLKRIRDKAPIILIRIPMIDRDWLTLYKKERGMEWRLDTAHFIEYTFESFRKEMKEAGLEIKRHSVQFGE